VAFGVFGGAVACGDIFAIDIQDDNTNGLGVTSVFSFEVNVSPNDTVATPITEGTGCTGGGGTSTSSTSGPPVESQTRSYVLPRATLGVSTLTVDYLLSPPVFDPPSGVQVCQQLNPTSDLAGTATLRCIGGTPP
jgi:hypothetical protein